MGICLGNTTIEFYGKDYLVDGAPQSAESLQFGEGQGILSHVPYSKKHRLYSIEWMNGLVILVKASKMFLSVTFDGNMDELLGDSVGMLGTYTTGDMVGRDGTLLTDFQAFGFEWQYRPELDGPMLFAESRAPQWPNELCKLPSTHNGNGVATSDDSKTKFLEKKKVNDAFLAQRAKVLCGARHPDDVEPCIEDVLLTGDVEMADAW